MERTVKHSQEDHSINVVTPIESGLFFESRFVQRDDYEWIIYISSDGAGCNLSCRMCWLTQLGRTGTREASVEEYRDQVKSVLAEIKKVKSSEEWDAVKRIHVNFMAQGDLFQNRCFTSDPELVLTVITAAINSAVAHGPQIKFKLSTIFPETSQYIKEPEVFRSLVIEPLLDDDRVDIYYSLYSLDSRFRRKWLPKAISPEVVGNIFRGVKRGFRLHFALIENRNDRLGDIELIHRWLERWDITAKFNLVRFNAFDGAKEAETDSTKMALYLESLMTSERLVDSQIVPRIGKDVKASCGMFYSKSLD